MTISEVAIKRPVFITMMAVGLAVLGILSLTRLGTDLWPDVKFPIVAVSVPYPGASPEDIERQIVKPIEDALVAINGVDQINGIARDNVGTVVVMFKLESDFEASASEVRQKVDAIVGQFPSAAEKPIISKADVGAAPILVYAASAPRPSEEVRQITEDFIKPALERIAGVAKVDILGGREREVQVALDPVKLESFALSPLNVLEKLRAENATIPAGHYTTGSHGQTEIGVRTIGEFDNVADLREAVIFAGPDGQRVRVGDVARVEDGFKEERTLIRANAKDAVAFQVVKTSNANTVKVSDEVKAALARLSPSLPKGYDTQLLIDQSSFIRENSHEVEIAIVYGGAMAILVILLFMMDLRSTFISALALPTAVLGTFVGMYALGYTLNMLTLIGLSLAIGLLIDDAVVVRENIFRHLEMGEPPHIAAANGTREITLAVIATTLTIVAVFLPVAFMNGIVGQFFRQFGITVSAAVLLSMLVAFTLDPMLSARMAKRVEKHHGADGVQKGVIGVIKGPLIRAFNFQDRVYESSLAFTLRHPIWVGLTAFVVFAGSLWIGKTIGTDFMTAEDRGQFMLNLEFPAETSLQETSRKSLEVEKGLLADNRFKIVYATIGRDGEANKAYYRVDVGAKQQRHEGVEALKKIAKRIAETAVPGVSATAEAPPMIEGLGGWSPIMISISGPSYEVLGPTAERIAKIVRETRGAADVHVDYTPPKSESRVVPDRGRAATAGLPIALIGMNVRIAVDGEKAGHLRGKDSRGQEDEIDIRIRLEEPFRNSPAAIARIPIAVRSADGRPSFVRLADVSRLVQGLAPAQINREDRERRVLVTASAVGRPLGELVDEMRAKIQAEAPPGYEITWLGSVKDMNETNASFGLAFALAILFIYVILASQFESFVHPATIMLSLPLALVGALGGLWITGNTLSMGSQIGILLLMGLVTKNAILLVDSALSFQREGMTPKAALMAAGPRRLRPILMTSSAMILGMLPTAISRGSGSEFRAPMAISVIGGVISSTLLTLLVVPVVYLAVEAIRARFLGLRKPAANPELPQAAE